MSEPSDPVGAVRLDADSERLRELADAAYKLANNKNEASGKVFHAVLEFKNAALEAVAALLVERDELREEVAAINGPGRLMSSYWFKQRAEAAEAEVVELREHATSLRNDVAALTAEREELRRQLDHVPWKASYDWMRKQRDDALAEVVELRERLAAAERALVACAKRSLRRGDRADAAEARVVVYENALREYLRSHNGHPGDPEPLCSCTDCVAARGVLEGKS